MRYRALACARHLQRDMMFLLTYSAGVLASFKCHRRVLASSVCAALLNV